MKYREFSSYNGLDRVVMIAGVPLVPAVLLIVATLILSLIAQKLLGLIGFAFLALALPIFLFLKHISETDDKAMNILALEMMFRLKRRYYSEFGNTLTYLPVKYLRNGKYIQQILKQANIFN